MYGLCSLAGFLVYHIFFARGPGPFEQTIWAGLNEGRRVVVCIDKDAFIFEMNGKKLRITRGVSDFEENRDDDGILADDVADVQLPKSINNYKFDD